MMVEFLLFSLVPPLRLACASPRFVEGICCPASLGYLHGTRILRFQAAPCRAPVPLPLLERTAFLEFAYWGVNGDVAL